MKPGKAAKPARRPLVLVVIDGWGLAPPSPKNALAMARTPIWDRLLREYPNTVLGAAGLAVGLPEGQQGNSEVGHLNIGAGRVVYQDLLRVNRAIDRGALARNNPLAETMALARAAGGTLHLAGLLGPGGVHAHEKHLGALLAMAAAEEVPRVALHLILDGRDTPPRSALGFLDALERQMAASGLGERARVATVAGRYWAMDRDKRWERTQRAWDAYAHGRGERAATAREAVEKAYARGEGDEFVAPTVVGEPWPVRDGDGWILTNFRSDRARQITQAFLDPAFEGFARSPPKVAYCCMTQYDDRFPRWGARVAFPPERPTGTLGEHYARLGLSQLRVAETEKYAHVTYFFSGGREDPFPREERLLVPSPKVATYDLAPEMSTPALTDALLARLDSGGFDLVVANFANPDMVGHTGVLEATVKAVESVDAALGRLERKVLDLGGVLAVTADHGNCEEMHDAATRQPLTSHTTNPVPLVLIGAGTRSDLTLREGALCDVAPTLLALVGLPRPPEMDGEDLAAPPRRPGATAVSGRPPVARTSTSAVGGTGAVGGSAPGAREGTAPARKGRRPKPQPI